MFGDKGDTGVIELKQICDTKDKFLRGANTKISLQTVDVGNVSLRLVTVPVCLKFLEDLGFWVGENGYCGVTCCVSFL